LGEQLGLAVCCEDEAGPYHTILYPATRWQPQGDPKRIDPHFERTGIAKVVTLFRPATGEVRNQGVSNCTNAVLHPWVKEQVSQVLATLPKPTNELSPEENRAWWESWREGLIQKVTLIKDLPPLRMLLIWDNIVGHTNRDLLCWLFRQGVLPLCTPLGGSWLNMAESVQHLMKALTVGAHHPKTPQEIITLFVETSRIWNTHPTPFVWGGKRAMRRKRAQQRRQGLSGSGAWTPRPIRFSFTALAHYERTNCNERSK